LTASLLITDQRRKKSVICCTAPLPARSICSGRKTAGNIRKWHQRAAGGEIILDKIQELSPKNDSQRSLQAQALNMAIDLGKMRWLMFEQGGSSISMPLLVMLVFWLTIIFSSFGLFAPRNATVVTTLFLCALAVAAAIFLILEMYAPFQGLIQISSAPLRSALAHLGQ
jgi:hypothetical protein